jgi:hypothetical protein
LEEPDRIAGLAVAYDAVTSAMTSPTEQPTDDGRHRVYRRPDDAGQGQLPRSH